MCEPKTVEDKRAEMLMKLLEEDRKSFNNRRSYEWKLSFAIWTALAILIGMVLQGKVHLDEKIHLVLIVPAVVVLLLHWYANKRIKLANDVDKREADLCARILRRRAITEDELTHFTQINEALTDAIEAVKDGNGWWSVWFHVGTTSLLLLVLTLALVVPHTAKTQETPDASISCCEAIEQHCFGRKMEPPK